MALLEFGRDVTRELVADEPADRIGDYIDCMSNAVHDSVNELLFNKS